MKHHLRKKDIPDLIKAGIMILGGLLGLWIVFTGCTMTEQAPPPPEVRMEPLPAAPIERVESCLLPAPREPVAYTPEKTRQMVKPNRLTPKPFSPMKLIADAKQAARVEPQESGYFGATVEHSYVWAPGKVYVIYLSTQHATTIVLPPGEKLISGLYLNPEAYEVHTDRTGQSDAVTIRPLIEKGSVDTLLMTESGRRYLLTLQIAPQGMLVVAFEAPLLPVQLHENPLETVPQVIRQK